MDVNLMIMLIALPLIIAIINIVLPLIVRKILSLAVVGYTLIATYLL